jgi:hypothetical protein
MVAEGAAFMVSGEWWIALFPGVALMIAVFCFNLLGDGVRDMVDPRRRVTRLHPAGQASVRRFRTRSGVVKALDNVGFSVGRVRPSRCQRVRVSKSVTAAAIMGLLIRPAA